MHFEEKLKKVFQDKYVKNYYGDTNTPIFESNVKPSISINEYYYRIIKFTKCDKSVIYLEWVLLKRLVFVNNVILSELNIHRLLSQAFNISLKFLDDDHPLALHEIFGYTKIEFFILEKEFLKLINYNCMIGIIFSNKDFYD